MCEEAHNYCLLGATNDELAEFFDVSPSTIDNWIAEPSPISRHAVKSGRVVADAKVARGLYARAVGYDRKVEREVILGGELKPVTSTVHYPRQRPGLHLLAAQPPPPDLARRAQRRSVDPDRRHRPARCRRRERARKRSADGRNIGRCGA